MLDSTHDTPVFSDNLHPHLLGDLHRESEVADVSWKLDHLPDGRESLTIGDYERSRDFCAKQGNNELGYKGTCGIASCAGILQRFGIEVSENDLVKYAVDHRFCEPGKTLEQSGGTTIKDQVSMLRVHGLRAYVEPIASMGQLAQHVQDGSGVIALVNAGVLWNDATAYGNGSPNHAITVTGVARDPQTDALLGFYVNDTGTGQAGHFVDMRQMQAACLTGRGGGNYCVVAQPIAKIS